MQAGLLAGTLSSVEGQPARRSDLRHYVDSQRQASRMEEAVHSMVDAPYGVKQLMTCCNSSHSVSSLDFYLLKRCNSKALMRSRVQNRCGSIAEGWLGKQ